jgi:ferredoxin
VSHHIRVHPIACTGHGACAELLPEMVTLDDWGYPMVDGNPVAPELLEHARRAAAACPTLALLLERRAPAQAAPAQRSSVSRRRSSKRGGRA